MISGRLTVAIAMISFFSCAHGAVIYNGSFDTCNFSGWQKDTDGFGNISTGTDFQMIKSEDDCSAQIGVDHWRVPGDITSAPRDQAWFSNTLYQNLDLAAGPNSTLRLSIDYEVATEGGWTPDYFLIGLNNGTGTYYDETGSLGFLQGPTEIGGNTSGSLSFDLDGNFNNAVGWALDFQLNIGVDPYTYLPDGYGSSLVIHSASLQEIKAVSVPEPGALLLLSSGLIALHAFRIKNKEH